jgi:hypothetical protein
VSLVLFGTAILYGVQLGRIYYRYYALVDEMRASARFAQSQSDEVIRRNLQASIDELSIPAEAKRVGVQRFGPPPTIRIRTEYHERLHLPLGRRLDLRFRPQVETRF